MIRTDFHKGMESVSLFKMNTVTEHNLIMWGIIFSQ